MALEVSVQREASQAAVPDDAAFQRWASAAAADRNATLVIRLVDAAESEALNQRYRGKAKPTNVLSFPAELPAVVLRELAQPPLGDLVICVPLVEAEAQAQGKAVAHHWAHLVMHGVLHLRGFDHETDQEAGHMEALERELLAGFGIADPYATD